MLEFWIPDKCLFYSFHILCSFLCLLSDRSLDTKTHERIIISRKEFETNEWSEELEAQYE